MSRRRPRTAALLLASTLCLGTGVAGPAHASTGSLLLPGAVQTSTRLAVDVDRVARRATATPRVSPADAAGTVTITVLAFDTGGLVAQPGFPEVAVPSVETILAAFASGHRADYASYVEASATVAPRSSYEFPVSGWTHYVVVAEYPGNAMYLPSSAAYEFDHEQHAIDPL